jgi:ribosome recycling factor
MSMMEEVFESMNDSVKKAHEALKTSLGRLRTGRANAALLDVVRVDYYGAMTPINQMASVTTPEPRLIMVKPFDRTAVRSVEKAIQIADLGLNPSCDGEIIRIPVPPLTEERRKELVKVVKKQGEECKVAIRNSRRDANDMLKEFEKSGDVAKDDAERGLKKIQEITDKGVADVDKILAAKEADIIEI